MFADDLRARTERLERKVTTIDSRNKPQKAS
jgi:hypothetical protein